MPTEFAALVAIDWPDEKHAWALQAGTPKVETGAIDHTPEPIDVWAAELRMRFGGQAVAVALEQSRIGSPSLGGHLKAGHRWTIQNPANGG